MADPLDPNFGVGFDADGFRLAIRNTMMMGLPNSASQRVTFRWKVQETFEKHDSGGNPYNFETSPVTSVSKEDVQIPAAVEFFDNQSLMDFMPAGQIESPKIKVTVLDSDFGLVEGADQILLDGSVYNVDFIEPPVGLFSVTIYTFHATAFDES